MDLKSPHNFLVLFWVSHSLQRLCHRLGLQIYKYHLKIYIARFFSLQRDFFMMTEKNSIVFYIFFQRKNALAQFFTVDMHETEYRQRLGWLSDNIDMKG